MTDVQFSTREVPWMKLGKLEETPLNSTDAAVAAGLDFDVELVPLQFTHNGETHTAPRFATVRTDTSAYFGTVSEKYEPVQFREAFAFMDQINTEYVAAGSLQSGRQAFMVVKLPDASQIASITEDANELFAVLRTSHDTTRAIEVMAMPLRGRCMNQLTLKSFSRGISNRWSYKHTKNVHEKLAEANDCVQRLSAYAGEFNRVTTKLVNTQVDTDTAQKLLVELVLPKWAKKNDDTVGHSDNAWGLVNAVSSYMEWERSGGTPESRFLGALQGQTYNTVNAMATVALTRL